MKNLFDYLHEHAFRSEPKDGDADMIFFGVRKGPDASADDLKAVIAQHKGEFCEVDLFDGKEHGYMEIGGWAGDQGAALALMGLGAALGMWQLLTPKTVLGDSVSEKEALHMAGLGMVSIMVINKKEHSNG